MEDTRCVTASFIRQRNIYAATATLPLFQLSITAVGSACPNLAHNCKRKRMQNLVLQRISTPLKALATQSTAARNRGSGGEYWRILCKKACANIDRCASVTFDGAVCRMRPDTGC